MCAGLPFACLAIKPYDCARAEFEAKSFNDLARSESEDLVACLGNENGMLELCARIVLADHCEVILPPYQFGYGKQCQDRFDGEHITRLHHVDVSWLICIIARTYSLDGCMEAGGAACQHHAH